jgi:hypothetical protein
MFSRCYGAITPCDYAAGVAETPERKMSDREEKLRELGAKLGLLYDWQAAMVWLFSRQPLLDGEQPAFLIREGRTREVIRLLDQIVEGAYL